MPDINYVLSSPMHYRQAFEEGLIQILKQKTAGTFILACANLFQHPEFLLNHSSLLHTVYTYIKEYYQACQRDGCYPEDAPDDVTVMESLIQIGLENLAEVECREVSRNEVNFLLSYNQLRSFRPPRMSKHDNIQLDTPFKPEGFHFDKPFLAKEIFAEGELLGKQLSLLYNKFPFVPYHALLVVDKTARNNQYLTQEYLDYITKLQSSIQLQCPELVIAYNSLAAGASVNHLHFHVYLETTLLPIFSKRFVHNGGNLLYPASCQVFNSSREAWKIIKKLHHTNTSYNLIFKDRKIFCLPRKMPEKEFKYIDTGTYGWSNMAGLINVDNKTMLKEITADQIISSLESVSAKQQVTWCY